MALEMQALVAAGTPKLAPAGQQARNQPSAGAGLFDALVQMALAAFFGTVTVEPWVQGAVAVTEPEQSSVKLNGAGPADAPARALPGVTPELGMRPGPGRVEAGGNVQEQVDALAGIAARALAETESSPQGQAPLEGGSEEAPEVEAPWLQVEPRLIVVAELPQMVGTAGTAQKAERTSPARVEFQAAAVARGGGQGDPVPAGASSYPAAEEAGAQDWGEAVVTLTASAAVAPGDQRVDMPLLSRAASLARATLSDGGDVVPEADAEGAQDPGLSPARAGGSVASLRAVTATVTDQKEDLARVASAPEGAASDGGPGAAGGKARGSLPRERDEGIEPLPAEKTRSQAKETEIAASPRKAGLEANASGMKAAAQLSSGARVTDKEAQVRLSIRDARAISETLLQESLKKLPRSVELRLEPPEMGKVTVLLSQRGQDVTVKFLAGTGEAQRMLSGASEDLGRALSEKGLVLTGFAVDPDNPGEAGRQSRGDAGRPGTRRYSRVAEIRTIPALPPVTLPAGVFDKLA